jgi:aspartate racemase
MHRCADAVSAATSISLIHIAEAIGTRAIAAGHTRLGLLGAEGTMSAPFYREKLEALGIEVLIPDDKDRAFIHDSIFSELCLGQFTDATRAKYLAIMGALKEQGAQGVILGCTEIEQLIMPKHTQIVLYPSAEIHARAGADFMLNNTEKAPKAA